MGKRSKGKKGPKVPAVTDGLFPKEMNRNNLLGHIVRLKDELEREREEPNFYMLERQKMFQMWNILLEQIQLEKEKAALFDAHMQDVEKGKNKEDNVYEQKLRFLKQEHTRRMGEVRLQHLVKMKHAQDEAWAIHMLMRESLAGKKRELRQAELAFYQTIRGLYWKHSKDVSNLNNEFAREIRRLETTFDRSLFENNEREEEEHDHQIALMASIKDSQVEKLIESHLYQALELEKFFRDLIRHNLALIYGMNDAAKKQKIYELRARKDLAYFRKRYEKYVKDAVQWKEEMEHWEQIHREDDPETLYKDFLQVVQEVKDIKHKSRMLECSNETLNQKIIIAEKERDKLKREFSTAIIEVQKRSSMTRLVNLLRNYGAKREGQLYEALADNVEKDENDTDDYFMSLISARDKECDELNAEIVDFATEHKNIEENYKENFEKNEIHVADIGFAIKATGERQRSVDEDILATTDESQKGISKRHASRASVKDIKRKSNTSSGKTSKGTMGRKSKKFK